MLGWYIDILIGYLTRILVRFFKVRRSETWPIEKARDFKRELPKIRVWGPVCGVGIHIYP
jgi:hypothetical protein